MSPDNSRILSLYHMICFARDEYSDSRPRPILGILACSVPFVLLLLWPFLDRSKERHPRKRPFAVTLGVVGVLGALFLGYLGHISETEQAFFGKRYHIDLLGWPHEIHRVEDTDA